MCEHCSGLGIGENTFEFWLNFRQKSNFPLDLCHNFGFNLRFYLSFDFFPSEFFNLDVFNLRNLT